MYKDDIIRLYSEKISQQKKDLKEKVCADLGRWVSDDEMRDMYRCVISNIPNNYIVSHMLNEPDDVDVYPLQMTDEGFKRSGKISFLDRFTPFIEHLDGKVVQDGHSLIFFGYNSSGKSHMGTWILAHAVSRGLSAYYIMMTDLYDLYNKARFSSEDEERGALEYIKNCDFLMIDELGKEPRTDASLSAIENMLKHRVANWKPTIIATNVDFNTRKDNRTGRVINDFKSKYGNSTFELIVETYFLFQFSKNGEFRKKKRLQWDF